MMVTHLRLLLRLHLAAFVVSGGHHGGHRATYGIHGGGEVDVAPGVLILGLLSCVNRASYRGLKMEIILWPIDVTQISKI